jgi:hypothetical protein
MKINEKIQEVLEQLEKEGIIWESIKI